MTTKLIIVTPLSRVNNLPLIYENLLLNSATLKLHWMIMVDEKIHHEIQRIQNAIVSTETLQVSVLASPSKNNLAGHGHKNVALEMLGENDWVYFLDDDNIIHPSLLKFISENDLFNSCDGIVVAQVWKNGAVRLNVSSDKIKVCHVDTASTVLSMRAIGETRFREGDYVADGYFIEEVYNKNSDKFLLFDIPMCYYNYLEYNIDECPVPLLQNMEEIKQCLSLYRSLNPKKILEIGTFFGGTLYHWLKNAELNQVVSIDYPIPPSDGRYQQMLDAKAKWKNWMLWDGFNWKYVGADSTLKSTIDEANSLFPNKDIDFLFIDGGHDYRTVKSDYDNYSPLVRAGGIIAFHDTVCEGEVAQYWNDLKKTEKNYLEIHDHKNGGNGIGIIFKK